MNYKDLRSIQETYVAMHTEGVRDKDAEKGTKERKARLEKKRGMKLDDHPEYKKEESVDEGLAGMVDKATKAAQGGLEKMGVKINRTPRPTARPSATTSNTMRQNKTSMEEVDVFDIVKGHLIDEGATEEEALKAMLSMTEEQINAIVEGAPYLVTNADKKANTPAYQNYLKGMKDKKGNPMYKAAPHLKGV